jgi:aspartyl-tRNA(Asn)/glutamyl-tRNA(Gln) amidotransferase subunit A
MLDRVALAVSELDQAVAPDEFASFDARSLIAGFARGDFTPSAVAAAALARIDRLDPSPSGGGSAGLGAMLAIDSAGALAAAERSTRRWRAGIPRPLEGVPIVVKDLIDTAGVATTGGSRWLAGRIPTADAGVVAAVRNAGAVILGKTATYELGCGDDAMPFGLARNPWNPEHTTGGSSAGSAAAIAARYAPLALGTDTGGSIRIPSSYCGVVGLKPTLGRLPTDGLLALAPTLDCTGPMGRTADDVALLFGVLAGDASALPDVRSMSVGVPRRWFTDVLDSDVASRFDDAVAALSTLPAHVVPIDLPGVEHGAPLSWLITMYEAAKTYAGAPRDLLSPAFRRRLEIGDQIPDAAYREALTARSRLADRVVAGFGACDVVVVPAAVSTAPPRSHLDRPVAGHAVTWPDVTARTMAVWNVTGLPSLAVPTGFAAGLPAGMQIVGRPHDDERCLALGVAYQQITDHHLAASPVDDDPRRGTDGAATSSW